MFYASLSERKLCQQNTAKTGHGFPYMNICPLEEGYALEKNAGLLAKGLYMF